MHEEARCLLGSVHDGVESENLIVTNTCLMSSAESPIPTDGKNKSSKYARRDQRICCVGF